MIIQFHVPQEDPTHIESLLQSNDEEKIKTAHERVKQGARIVPAILETLTKFNSVRLLAPKEDSYRNWSKRRDPEDVDDAQHLILEMPDEDTARKVAAIFAEYGAGFDASQDYGQRRLVSDRFKNDFLRLEDVPANSLAPYVLTIKGNNGSVYVAGEQSREKVVKRAYDEFLVPTFGDKGAVTLEEKEAAIAFFVSNGVLSATVAH